MSSHDNWPAGQLCHARRRVTTAALTVTVGIGTTFSGAALAVLDRAALGLGLAAAGMVVMVTGFEQVGRCVDGTRPNEADECSVARVPLGGRRPAGRRPAEPPIRTAVGRLNLPFTARSWADQEAQA